MNCELYILYTRVRSVMEQRTVAGIGGVGGIGAGILRIEQKVIDCAYIGRRLPRDRISGDGVKRKFEKGKLVGVAGVVSVPTRRNTYYK